ncbi:MAG: YihY/virulence factor BrkB family protein [Gracilimonas sp.]|uniref:YihY/virulence factor BrkB family protein n=1 Tax=Gracilimonas TaxID=649462 RepID=UPI001B111B57|nr:YihY/virulence factor BrkB family protein [Gracilimonas sp.]MBO6584603.1 YihY/virulence factor BrkB family protein [Gracilimonas sp.]MBO6616126.1 YihY/virulence factor BrkB family protein [Gracilimonas sp.]
MKLFKRTSKIVLSAINSFIEDNCFQYSAAVSFYTLFSLAPIVMIAVYIAGFFIGDASVMRELTNFLEKNIGQASSEAVMLLVETIQTDSRNILYLFLSIAFLIISATTVFIQFKDSFNRVLNVVAKPEIGFSKVLIDRVMAFGMIMLLGIAMIFSLILDSTLVWLFEFLLSSFETAQLYLIGFGSNILTLFMVFFAVLVMFYTLPDAKVRWRPLLIGSLITTLLLAIGKFGVGMIIGNSSLNQLSGASSSIIILMLWVYYSSNIIFFGIELVKALAEYGEGEIKAGRFARKIKMVEMPGTKKESDKL